MIFIPSGGRFEAHASVFLGPKLLHQTYRVSKLDISKLNGIFSENYLGEEWRQTLGESLACITFKKMQVSLSGHFLKSQNLMMHHFPSFFDIINAQVCPADQWLNNLKWMKSILMMIVWTWIILTITLLRDFIGSISCIQTSKKVQYC